MFSATQCEAVYSVSQRMWHVVFTLNMPTRHGTPDVPVREHRSLESGHSIL